MQIPGGNSFSGQYKGNRGRSLLPMRVPEESGFTGRHERVWEGSFYDVRKPADGAAAQKSQEDQPVWICGLQKSDKD